MVTPLADIRPVNDKKSWNDFIHLPWQLYQDDPNWVPPLLMEIQDRLNPEKNHYFEHAKMQAWVAYEDARPVGRITAQLDELVYKYHGEKTGHFGFFETIDDPAVANALFAVAEDWLRRQGAEKVVGPFSLSINEESGLQVDGFDEPSFLMMPHHLPYYAALVEQNGYHKVKDLYAYEVGLVEATIPRAVKRVVASTEKAEDVVFRKIDRNNYDEDLATILDIFNDAWRDNWGFLPFTNSELKHTAKSLKLLIREDFTTIVEHEGRPVAMMVTLPNVNEAIADLNGRLFPFGWLKLLWRIKVKTTRTVRIPLMGIRKDIQSTPLGGAIALALIYKCGHAAIDAGCRQAEYSWVLEDNTALRKILDAFECYITKTYRLYEKSLS